MRILNGSETLLKEDDQIRLSRGRLDEVQRRQSEKKRKRSRPSNNDTESR